MTATAPPFTGEAFELLHAGLCDPRCLLAMETPPGDADACTCRCRGLYHAALTFAEVLPQPWMCPECGAAPEDCIRGHCCPNCGHPPQVLDTARRFLIEATERETS